VNLVKHNNQLLPKNFDDLEDEDHADAVDTDQEDYHPFNELDAIDESE